MWEARRAEIRLIVCLFGLLSSFYDARQVYGKCLTTLRRSSVVLDDAASSLVSAHVVTF
jgi:hypothetical protein